MENLVTLQDLFKNYVFKVPDYQRGYSWENRHRRDLLEDLGSIQVSRDPNAPRERRHYTGTVVLEPQGTEKGFGEDYQKHDVVDGQQRLTTLVILLKAIRSELRLIGGTRADNIAKNVEERYISVGGPQGSIYKLSLDSDNDFFFKRAVLEDKLDVEPTIKSHQNLLDAKNQFGGYLEKLKDTKSSDDYLEALDELTHKITQQLAFTVYHIEDNSEVGVIFEVMNDRGKPLSELEKIKNFLMYMTNRVSDTPISTKQLIDKINFSWKEILPNLAKAGKFRSQDEDQFLRVSTIVQFYSDLSSYNDEDGQKVYVSSQLGDIHELLKRRFKELEKDRANYRVNCYKQIENYVDALRGLSYWYRDVARPYEGFAFQNVKDEEMSQKLRSATAQFERLETEATLLPILTAVFEVFQTQPSVQLSLLQLLEVFAFRVYGIGGHRSQTAQNQIYTLACDVYHRAKDAPQIETYVRELTKEYVPDETIEGYLADPKVDYYGWDYLEYFLYEYERSKCELVGKRPYFEWEYIEKGKREDTIEHILPQTIRYGGAVREKYWCDRYTEEQHLANVRRLGNLTLTEKNTTLYNHGFDVKKATYAKSRWEIERELSDLADWTPAEIDERGNQLIAFAQQRWKV
jgi:hypothetical protein